MHSPIRRPTVAGSDAPAPAGLPRARWHRGVNGFLRRSVLIVAPTSWSAKATSFGPDLEFDGQTTRVLIQQIGAVDAGRLGRLSDHLSPEELWGVDGALLTILGLSS